MWELDHKESWMPKNWCSSTVVLEKTLESPLDSKEIKPVNPKGNLSWIFISRTDAETEAPILWPPDEKSRFTRKDLDVGKDWRQEEKGITEDEVVGWHHWLNGRESEQAPGDGKGHWHAAVHGVAKSQTRLSDWTTDLLKTSYFQLPMKGFVSVNIKENTSKIMVNRQIYRRSHWIKWNCWIWLLLADKTALPYGLSYI